jgi:aminopeptidase N
MLRGLYGAERFREGIRHYVATNADRPVVSEDLRAAFEHVTGDDLSWFFDQWVYSSGHPELAVESVWDAKDGAVHVRVTQTQPVSETMPLFRSPVDVEVRWADGAKERRRIDLFRAKHDWRIPGKAEPVLVIFDPDGWLLARINETKPRAAWEKQLDASVPIASRIDAVRALGAVGVDGIAGLAKAASSDPRFEVRVEACKALEKIGGALVADALVAASKDAESRVRRAAVNALATVPAAFSQDALRERLGDKSDYVTADAAWAFGKVKAEGAFDALTALLEKRESHRDQVRQRTMDGLRELGDPRGAEVARRYLGYEWGKGIQHQFRKAALDAMVTLAPKAPETHAAVLELLTDPYFRMRNWAAEKAADLKLMDAIPALEANEKNGKGMGVRESAKAALERLRGPAKPAEPAK